MPRYIRVAAAQIGAVHRTSSRLETLQRMIQLLDEAIAQNVQLVVYPETTFTTFFPRHLIHSAEDLDVFFESGEDITANSSVKPLFQRAKSGGVDLYVGYAERCADGRGYNSSIYYSGSLDKILSKYRKVHLPGTVEPFADPHAINQLEKRYFSPGDLGFKAFRIPCLVPDKVTRGGKTVFKGDDDEEDTLGKGDPIAGMLICNDRRWPEAWRVYGLQGVELVLCGYNTPAYAPDLYGQKRANGGTSTSTMTREEMEADAYHHHRLVMEANSYMNSCFSISAARAGLDDGKYALIGGSSIVSPRGRTIAQAKGTGDELVVAQIDLDDCKAGKETVSPVKYRGRRTWLEIGILFANIKVIQMFNFGAHRRVETYGLITSQTGVVEPSLLDTTTR